ncbi:hypothetical protein D3C77_316810 [compost metagenome]
MDGRAVGLVEARLEHVRDAQLFGDAHVFGAGGQGQVQGFKDVDAAEEDERGGVGAFNGVSYLQRGFLARLS